MKLTIRSVAITAAVMLAAPALTGCGPEAAPVDAPPTQQSAPGPTGTDDCEADDIGEGDFLADCFGAGDPQAEDEGGPDAPIVIPPAGKPSTKTSPTCKRGEKVKSGKCVKTNGRRR